MIILVIRCSDDFCAIIIILIILFVQKIIRYLDIMFKYIIYVLSKQIIFLSIDMSVQITIFKYDNR